MLIHLILNTLYEISTTTTNFLSKWGKLQRRRESHILEYEPKQGDSWVPAHNPYCLLVLLHHCRGWGRHLQELDDPWEQHVSDFATPWTIQSVEFSRPKYWSGWPFPSPGDLPNTGIEPRAPTLQADSLPAEPQGKLTTKRYTLIWDHDTISEKLKCKSHIHLRIKRI